MKITTCTGCGGAFPDLPGPTHRYMESSPGCWAAYGEILAREYSDRAFLDIHRLTVDTYAVQHPGRPSPQSIKSVGYHLVRLCLLIEKGLEMERANEAMLAITKSSKENFIWLTPPPSIGSFTVADVIKTRSTDHHKQLVRSWATSAWCAWSQHHQLIHTWLPPLK